MSICAIADRTILLNITNMDDRGGDKTIDFIPSGELNEVREPKGVKADPTPPAASPIVRLTNNTNSAQSDGQNTQRKIRLGNTTRKDSLRSMHEKPLKLGSGSGSGDQEIPLDECLDPAAKKRKTRRGKPKHRKLKPYLKAQSYEQRMRCRAIGRLTKTGGQPPAPYNTTQFLMEDHSDLPDLEQKLADAVTSEMPPSFQKPLAPPRTRDSSFSIDSDEDYFYSSPEDEEEFLTKEFSSAYEDLHAERLNMMSKTELIQEYVQLEAKLDLMTKRLRGKSFQQLEERESETKNGNQGNDTEIAKKLKIFQQRIDDLIQQNEQLRRENETLRNKNCSSPVSSVDSESDSDSTSNSSRSDAGSNNGKSFQSRREKERRRNKRVSSVDSDSSTSSKNEPKIHNDNSKLNINDLPNGNSKNQIDLPT